MTDETKQELLRLFTELENSADDTGCDGDLTVISKSALEALSEFFGTHPEFTQ